MFMYEHVCFAFYALAKMQIAAPRHICSSDAIKKGKRFLQINKVLEQVVPMHILWTAAEEKNGGPVCFSFGSARKRSQGCWNFRKSSHIKAAALVFIL